MLKEYYSMQETVDYLNSIGEIKYSLSDLADLEMRNELTPLFRYDGGLLDCGKNNPFPFDNEGRIVKLTCYVAPLYVNVIDQLVKQNKTRIIFVKLMEILPSALNSYGVEGEPDMSHAYVVRNERSTGTINKSDGFDVCAEDCWFLISEVEALISKQSSEAETLLNQKIVELENEVSLLHQRLKDSQGNSQDEVIKNPNQKSTVAKMIGRLILVALPDVLKNENGLLNHGVQTWVAATTKVSPETAEKWIELAEIKLHTCVRKVNAGSPTLIYGSPKTEIPR